MPMPHWLQKAKATSALRVTRRTIVFEPNTLQRNSIEFQIFQSVGLVSVHGLFILS